ncbi:hypothetical protein CsSME_00007862 [Camellia sinensis var. sinensis]
MLRKGGRKLFLQSLSTTGLKDIVTSLHRRSGVENQPEENPRRHVEAKKTALENIGMFRRRSFVSTRPMEGCPKGLTMTLEVVHQKG